MLTMFIFEVFKFVSFSSFYFQHNSLEIVTKPSMEDLMRSSSPIWELMEQLCVDCNGKYCILYFPICIKSLIYFND